MGLPHPATNWKTCSMACAPSIVCGRVTVKELCLSSSDYKSWVLMTHVKIQSA